MPAKNDNAVSLLNRVTFFAGKPRSYKSLRFDAEPEARKVHMHHAAPLVFTTQNQFFTACKQQLTRHRVNAVVDGGNDHLLASLKTIRLVELLIRQCGRCGICLLYTSDAADE